MTSHPPHDKWTEADIENQRRIFAQVEREIAKMQIRLAFTAIAIAVGLAVAIHFLSKP